ncbi:MAG: hypothetical protein GC161_07785 [Planctomycetaceae bacterium]|nr:hypothetical protein [Planctomycetaceae bacterium]
MKLARTQIVLALVLVAVALADWALAPRAPLARGGGAPLFSGFDAELVRGARLRGPTGDTLRLARDAEGRWTLTDHHEYPAAGHDLEQALLHVARLGAAERVATDGGEALGFEEQAVGVEFEGGGGETLLAFDLLPAVRAAGAAAAAGAGAPGTYLRAQGSMDVYRAPLVPPLSAEPERHWNLIVARLFDAPEDGPERIAVAFDGKPALELVREGGAGGTWFALEPRDARAQAIAVERLVATASRLVADRLVAGEPAPEHGLEQPAMELVLTYGDKRTLRLRFAPTADQGYHLSSPDWRRPWVLRLAPGTVAPLIDAVKDVRAGLR